MNVKELYSKGSARTEELEISDGLSLTSMSAGQRETITRFGEAQMGIVYVPNLAAERKIRLSTPSFSSRGPLAQPCCVCALLFVVFSVRVLVLYEYHYKISLVFWLTSQLQLHTQ